MTFHELKKISRSMDHMEASAFLHKNFPVIGEGAHRKVFQLSDDVIIKIDLPHHIEKTKKYKFKFLKNIYPKAFNSSFTENYMEVAKYQECQKCSVSDFMPKYIGKINMTDSSLLVAWELIKDHDGSPSKELGHYIDGQNGKTIINNIAEFKKVLLSCKEKFHTVTPSNLLLQKTNPDKFRIKFIDFGSWQDLNIIPFASFSQTIYQAKINRRFRKRFYNKPSKSKGSDQTDY